MVVSQCPHRLSLAGGGTDFPEFFNEHGGAVVSTTIDKFVYSMVRKLPPYFDYKYRIRYTKREEVGRIEEIKNPVVREVCRYMNIEERIDTGIEVIHTADIPAMSGVGSSSSFAVGLLSSLHELLDEKCSKRKLAEEAIHVERDLIGDAVGWQDQVSAALGGINLIEFNSDGFSVTPLSVDDNRIREIEDRTMLFFTGFARNSSDIQKQHVASIPTNIPHLLKMKDMAYRAKEMLEGDISPLGELLHECWLLKRGLTDGVSNERIDGIYDRALKAGASGGKLMGAGSSGFMFFWCEPDKQDAVKAELSDLLHVPIGLKRDGAQIIFAGSAC